MASVLSASHFHNEDAAFDYVEAHLWPNGPVCPRCGATKERVGRLQGKTTRPGLRKCYACRKPFTVRIGSIFEDSHLALHLWLQAIHLICSSKKGISTRQLQRTLGVGMKTAWFLGHRIRHAMDEKPGGLPPMGGDDKTVEADVTYLGRKPGMKLKVGIGTMNPIFSLVEREGVARSFRMPNVRGENLHNVMEKHVSLRSHLMTDEAKQFVGIGWNFREHSTINHTRDEYVRGSVHTNTVEGFFSILKRGVYGVFQHVSEAHLHRYLAEFDFRYSNRAKLGIDDTMRASNALKGFAGKRLTYETVGKA